MTWATNHDASLEILRRVQGSLTVDLIMVPRSSFATCSADDTAAQVKVRNTDQFSYFPVTDGNDSILGLYHAERWFTSEAPETQIGDDFTRLSEDIVIGADASIFDFITQADIHPTNLVVSGNQIAGLVSLSDLQQLPVRAAFFALVTSLEMAMALRMRCEWQNDPNGWLDLLSDDQKKKIEKEFKKSVKRNTNIDKITSSSLSQKETVVLAKNFLSNRHDWPERFKKFRDLRNDLAHAKPYADTVAKAKALCGLVRDMISAKEQLLQLGLAKNATRT